jgi:hypothetical protein
MILEKKVKLLSTLFRGPMLEQLVRPVWLQLEPNSASVQPHSGSAIGGHSVNIAMASEKK